MRLPQISDFDIDLSALTARVRSVPSCVFRFHEYVNAIDWPYATAFMVTNPGLLPGDLNDYAITAKLAVVRAGMTHRRPM
jgi:hypothetical protein